MKTVKQYHEGKKSYSLLKNFSVSELQAMAYMTEKKKETPAMLFGKLFHSVMAGVMDKEFAIINELERPNVEMTMATKVNKQWKAELIEQAESNNLTIVTNEMVDLAYAMRSSVVNHPVGNNLLRWKGEVEQSYENDIFMGRFDKVFHDKKIILDWKSTERLNPQWIESDIIKYGYDGQAAIYNNILECEYAVMLFFVEKKYPHDCLPVMIPPTSQTMIDGMSKVNTWLHMANEAFENDKWPGISQRFFNNILELG